MLAQENFTGGMIFSSTVPASFTGGLLDYLVKRFTYLSAKEWQEQLERGRICQNGGIVVEDRVVSGGDVLAFAPDLDEFPEPPADLSYTILYEDQWLLAIDKPGDLLVHRAGRSVTHNLIYQLRFVHQPRYPEAGAVNRLDRETSGVILLARRPQFLASLNALFARHAVAKSYLAVVAGHLMTDQGLIDCPIGRDSGSDIPYRYCAGARAVDSKTAVTHYQVVARYPGRSLLRLWPETGRTHQLRVHLAHIGHPILGDKLYGATDQEFLAWRDRPVSEQGDGNGSRQALHAESLEFVHPWTGEVLRVAAELPSDMRTWCQEG